MCYNIMIVCADKILQVRGFYMSRDKDCGVPGVCGHSYPVVYTCTCICTCVHILNDKNIVIHVHVHVVVVVPIHLPHELVHATVTLWNVITTVGGSAMQ